VVSTRERINLWSERMTLHKREFIVVPYVPGYGLCSCHSCDCKSVTECFVKICDCCLED